MPRCANRTRRWAAIGRGQAALCRPVEKGVDYQQVLLSGFPPAAWAPLTDKAKPRRRNPRWKPGQEIKTRKRKMTVRGEVFCLVSVSPCRPLSGPVCLDNEQQGFYWSCREVGGTEEVPGAWTTLPTMLTAKRFQVLKAPAPSADLTGAWDDRGPQL